MQVKYKKNRRIHQIILLVEVNKNNNLKNKMKIYKIKIK